MGALALSLSGAARAATFVVDRADDPDVALASTCSTNSNDCSLRGAIAAAARELNSDTITFDPTVFGAAQTIVLSGTELAVQGDLSVTAPPAGVTLSGNGASRIFNVAPSGSLTLRGLTLTNGATSGDGGAISNEGDLILDGCTLAGNSASNGGAVFSPASSFTVVRDCALTGNFATNSGGAVFTVGYSGLDRCLVRGNLAQQVGGGIYAGKSVSIDACTFARNSALRGGGVFFAPIDNSYGPAFYTSTFSGNAARDGGGGIYNSTGNLTLYSCTLTLNRAPVGAGIASVGGTGAQTSLSNTIVAGNVSLSGQAGHDVDFVGGATNSFASGNNNLIGNGNATGAFTQSRDQIGVTDPKLGPLRDNGGPTPTHAVLPNSPALDTGGNGLFADQRGIERPQGLADDIGAFEFQLEGRQNSATLVVNTLRDGDDGICGPTDCTLREAIADFNRYSYSPPPSGPAVREITFAPNVRGTIKLGGTPLPSIFGNIRILGPGSKLLTVDAGGANFILDVRGDDNVLSGLTLSNGAGRAPQYDGDFGLGGALTNAGTLTLRDFAFENNSGPQGGSIVNTGTATLEDCVFNGNRADNVGGAVSNAGTLMLTRAIFSGNAAPRGGAIYNDIKGSILLNAGTFSGNSAGVYGGAIYNKGALTVSTSTMSGNAATARGGAIYNENATLTLEGSTLSGNRSARGGAVGNFSGALTLGNCTLSENVVVGATASEGGGAIDSLGADSSVDLDSCTIAGNSAPDVGGARAGIWKEDGTLALRNCIVALNGNQDIQANDGTLSSGGANLIGNAGGASGLGSNDRVGVTESQLQLSALADNGGPTLTRLPGDTSVAIDAGNTDLTTDQRGMGRSRGLADDIGAVETTITRNDGLLLSVGIGPLLPKTNDKIHSVARATTAAGTATRAALSYVWKRNGATIAGETRSTLDLRGVGNGDKGDVITSEVTRARRAGQRRHRVGANDGHQLRARRV